MYRAYETDSGLVAITATGLSAPLLYATPPATADGNLFKVVVSCETGAGVPTVPTSSSLAFTFSKTTGIKAGGAAVSPSPIGPSSLAANLVASSGTTAITGLTQSTELGEWTIPFTPGSSNGDNEVNTGAEIYLAASGTYAFFVTVPAGPGFGANLFARVVILHGE